MHYGCPLIRDFALNFAGRLGGGRKCVALCCAESIADIPAVPLAGTGEETILAFRRMRERVLLECLSPTEERIFTAGCLKCANFQMGEWGSNFLVNYVNVSSYPAPCQSKCFYCDVHDDPRDAINSPGVAEAYEIMFDALDFALGDGLIAPNAVWQISSGEIAIHPYRDRILDMVRDRTAIFFTNCFRFDYQIAANLAANPASYINLSIDSGTRETWHRIKGFDNFGKVVENLAKYRGSSARAGQITLKYIVLPGVNDGRADFEGVVALMKALGTGHLTLARESSGKYSGDRGEADQMVEAAGRLVAMLHRNNLTYDMFTFSPAERERTARAAAGILRGADH